MTGARPSREAIAAAAQVYRAILADPQRAAEIREFCERRDAADAAVAANDQAERSRTA